MKGKFVSYIRVSTERQGQSGLGLDAQRKIISDYLNGGAWKLLHELVEVESGKSATNRPKLQEAINHCRLYNATLLVAKLDRLSRDLWFITTIQKMGIKFVCADNPEINELTIHILGAMAQYERKIISERTRNALAAAKNRGIKLGNPNLGNYRNKDTSKALLQKARKADDFAKTVFPTIKQLLEQGTISLSMIAKMLNLREIKTRRGSNWTAIAVSRVLKRIPKDYSGDDVFSV